METRTCTGCDGRGYVPRTARTTRMCPVCNGKGQVPLATLTAEDRFFLKTNRIAWEPTE